MSNTDFDINTHWFEKYTGFGKKHASFKKILRLKNTEFESARNLKAHGVWKRTMFKKNAVDAEWTMD